MANAPNGTGDWFGWTNAVVSDLIPMAAALEVRRRRRAGQPTGYPLAVLVGFALLSLAAQGACAKPSASGWLLACIPALGFLALTKLVLSRTPAVPDMGSVVVPELVRDDASCSAYMTPDVVPKSVSVSVETPTLVASLSGAADAAPPVTSARRKANSADRVARAAARMPAATVAQIAAKAGVSESTARRHLPRPDSVSTPTPITTENQEVMTGELMEVAA
jgi:hypothetical protein